MIINGNSVDTYRYLLVLPLSIAPVAGGSASEIKIATPTVTVTTLIIYKILPIDINYDILLLMRKVQQKLKTVQTTVFEFADCQKTEKV